MPNIFVIYEKTPYHEGFENLFATIGLNTTAIRYNNLVTDMSIAEEADIFFLDLTRFEKRSFILSEIQEKFRALPIVVSHMESELSHADLSEFENVIEFIPQPVSIPDLAGEILNAWHGYVSELGKGIKGVEGLLQDQNLTILIQTFVSLKQSGMVQLETEMNRGKVYFKKGVLIDAEYRELAPEDALNKMMLWQEGRFQISFFDPEQKPTLTEKTEILLARGLERISDYLSFQEKLGGPNQKFYALTRYNSDKLDDEELRVMQSFIMGKTIATHLASAAQEDLKELELLVKIYDKKLLFVSKNERDGVDEKNRGLSKIFNKFSIFSKNGIEKMSDDEEISFTTKNRGEGKDILPYQRRFAVAQLNELKEKLKFLTDEKE